MKCIYIFCLCGLSLLVSAARAKEIVTNSVHMAQAPDWVTRTRTDKVIDHIQMVLEWDIRKIEVLWYTEQSKFEKMHGLGPNVLAISRKNDNTIHIGPKINSGNFDQVFGHELVHIISFQKYKEAIPRWLEEGLANYLSKNGAVDYKWLAAKPFPDDVRNLTHPFSGTVDNLRYHYIASQALAEMIAKKCDLAELLRLSVGQKMESYLDSYCEIHDLNAAYRAWVKKHAG